MVLKHRKPNRLENYNYSQNGLYFITICVKEYECLFGKIKNNKIILNNAGQMIQTIWNEIPKYYNNINIDAFQIMPNHVHGIIEINNSGKDNHGGLSLQNNNGTFPVGTGPCACPDLNACPNNAGLSLSDVIHRFKTITTKRYIDGVKQNNWQSFEKRFWQRSFHDHIIRNEKELNKIREYILNNPLKWEFDEDNIIVTENRA